MCIAYANTDENNLWARGVFSGTRNSHQVIKINY